MAQDLGKIAVRRGYVAIKVRERGNVPRNMRKAFNAASKEAWHDTAVEFDRQFLEDRFTPEHAKKANYTKRKKGYFMRKLKHPERGGGPGRADPLVFSGKTRKQLTRRRARVTSTSKGGKAAYAGARVFNFRNPKSQVRMNEEFRRIIPEEAKALADYYDRQLDLYLEKQDGESAR